MITHLNQQSATVGVKHAAAFAVLLVLMLPLGAAEFQESRAGSLEVEGDADITLDQNIVERILSQLGVLSFFTGQTKSVVEQGSTVTFTVADVADETCDDAGFIVEAYAPEPPSDRDWEVRDIDHLYNSEPFEPGFYLSGVATLGIPSDATTGEWTTITYLYCYDDGLGGSGIISEVGTTTFEVVESTDGTSDPLEPEPELQVVGFPDVDNTSSSVTTAVTLQNVGGDMTESWAVEMQVVDKGSGPLSVVGDQDVCDPNNQNAVHKDFRLGAGEVETIDLSVTGLDSGQFYDVYLGTATDCINDGGERVEPYPQATKISTVCPGGGCGQLPVDIPMVLLVGGGLLLIIGAGVVLYGRN